MIQESKINKCSWGISPNGFLAKRCSMSVGMPSSMLNTRKELGLHLRGSQRPQAGASPKGSAAAGEGFHPGAGKSDSRPGGRSLAHHARDRGLRRLTGGRDTRAFRRGYRLGARCADCQKNLVVWPHPDGEVRREREHGSNCGDFSGDAAGIHWSAARRASLPEQSRQAVFCFVRCLEKAMATVRRIEDSTGRLSCFRHMHATAMLDTGATPKVTQGNSATRIPASLSITTRA
jgi:hypothetical protein